MGLAYTAEAIGFLKEYLEHPDQYLPMCDQVWEHFDNSDRPGRLVGWNAGVIDGNRPFFYYASATDTFVTYVIFISTEGLSGWSRKELVPFLCNAGLLDTFGSNKEEVAPMTFEIEGRNGNRFLSINFLGDGDLHAYEGGYFLPFEALNDFNSTREPFPEPEPKPKPVRKPRTTTTAKPATKRRAKKKPATKKTPIITAPKKRGRPPKEKT